jgi:hypothetical protein
MFSARGFVRGRPGGATITSQNPGRAVRAMAPAISWSSASTTSIACNFARG